MTFHHKLGRLVTLSVEVFIGHEGGREDDRSRLLKRQGLAAAMVPAGTAAVGAAMNSEPLP